MHTLDRKAVKELICAPERLSSSFMGHGAYPSICEQPKLASSVQHKAAHGPDMHFLWRCLWAVLMPGMQLLWCAPVSFPPPLPNEGLAMDNLKSCINQASGLLFDFACLFICWRGVVSND
eukprot:1140952-Pelagomonas_calceolata.AAC.6